MIKVTDTVLDLISADELALEAMRAGLLNYSAFADKIHSQVENLTKKPVQKGTIVVAISRIAKNTASVTLPLKPDVKLTDLSIKSSLSALTFEKSLDIQRKIAVLTPFQLSTQDLFTVTEGPTEVTLIISEKAKDKIIKEFATKPKSETNNLVAITVQFSENLAKEPNLHFVLLSSLAAKRIQIIEIVSTFTETTFIIKKENMEEAIKALNTYFNKN